MRDYTIAYDSLVPRYPRPPGEEYLVASHTLLVTEACPLNKTALIIARHLHAISETECS